MLPLRTGFTSTIGVLFSASRWRHTQTSALDGGNLDHVQADRIWPVRRTGIEYTRQGSVGIASRVDSQHVALRTVEPGDHDHVVTFMQSVQTVDDSRYEDEPCLWCAFVRLCGAAERSVSGDSTQRLA